MKQDSLNYALLISSCDNFSDLWNSYFCLLNKNWIGDKPDIFLLTDKPTDRCFDGVKILCFDGNMPERIKKALVQIKNECVLLTLDDYFVVEEVSSYNLSFLASYAITNSVDYLSIYNRFFIKKKYIKPLDCFKIIDLQKKYAINLYPAFWKKDFLMFCIDKDSTPWEFEPKLTSKAIKYKAKCLFNNSKSFFILDVIRKGKVLHKAKRYFKKNGINIGNRKTISYFKEFSLAFRDCLSRFLPRWLFKTIKKAARKLGFKFYSDD